MVSALEAEGPPFYQKYRKSMEFHEKTMFPAKFRDFTLFRKMEAPAPPWVESLIFLRGYWCFGEAVQQKNTELS